MYYDMSDMYKEMHLVCTSKCTNMYQKLRKYLFSEKGA